MGYCTFIYEEVSFNKLLLNIIGSCLINISMGYCTFIYEELSFK